MNLFGSIGNGLHRLGTDITHPFGMGNPAPQQQPQPIRTPAPVPQQAAAPRPTVRTPAPVAQTPNFAQHALGSIGNALSHIGAAPHPVNTAPQQVVNQINNAKYGVLAHNQQAQQNVVHQLQASQAPKQSVAQGLSNAGDALNQATMKTIVQPMITRPAAEVTQTARQLMTHKASTYTPGGSFQQGLFGNTPVASIQKKVSDQYNRQSTSSSPVLRVASRPLAALEGAASVANDLPVVGAAAKFGVKGVKAATPAVEAGLRQVAPKIAPALIDGTKAAGANLQDISKSVQQAGKAIQKPVQAVATAVKDNRSISAQQRDIASQVAAKQAKIAALPINNHTAAETLNKQVDTLQARHAALESQRPKLPSIKPINQGGYVANPFHANNPIEPAARELSAAQGDKALTNSLANAADSTAARVEFGSTPGAASTKDILANKTSLMDKLHIKPINENGSIPIGKLLPEDKLPAKKPLPGESQKSSVSSANGTKVRGLTKGIKNSPEFSPALQSKVSSKYTPFTDKAATQSTGTFMKQPLDDAHTQVLQALAQNANPVIKGASGSVMGHQFGVQFGKQEVSNASAVMKALDQAGRHDEASIIHDQLAQKLTNAGQTSQAAKLIYNRTPEGLQNMARKSFNDKGVKINPALQKQMDAGLAKIKATADGSRENQLARAEYNRLVGTHIPTTAGNKALSLYKTGILSSPKTAVKVLGAGLPNLALENAADAIAAPIDRAVSLFTGKRAVTAPSINSMTAGAKALPKAISDAKIRFSKDIAMPGSTGLAGNELSGTVARPHGANFGIAKDGGRTKLDKATNGVSSKILNGYTSSIGRVHGAFQTLPYEVRAAQSLAQSAKAEAINQGLKGAEQTAFIHDFTAHPENYGKAGKQALATADESAQYATSQQHTALGSAASSIQRTMPGGQVIAPITRIPGAVATQVVNYSPAGVIKTGIQAGLDKKAGLPFNQQGFSRGIGRSIVGTALMGGGAALALQGRVSGAYPKDKATQQLWTSANIPANSVYVGGKAYPNEPWKNSGGTWQQISSPGGAGAQAGLTGGAVVDGYKNGGTAGAVLGGTQGGASIVTNQPYLTGVSGAMGAINTPSQAKSFFDQTAGSVVPNALRDVASSTDPLQRQTSVQSPVTSAKNAITNGIPGLREKNQPQVDTMGNTLQRNNDPLTAALNPLNPQKSTPSDLTNAMGAIHNSKDVNGKPLPIPTQIDKKYTIKDASGKTSALSDAQRTQFIQSTGQASQAQLGKLMATDAYKNATPEQQSKMMGDVVSGQRDLGKQQLGNATKLTPAGKAARDGVLPTVGMNGKVTATGGKLDLPKGMNGNDVATLERYNGMKAADKTKIMTTEPDAQYKLQLAEYERDKRLGTKTPQQLQTQEEALNKAKIGSTFSPEVRNTYDMGKNDAFNYIATNKNGGQLSKDVIAYGDALAKAGIENNKFVDNKGNITITPKGKMVVPGDKVTATAQSNGVPADIFAALVKQESGGNQGAVSPVGAIGLTQLMPDTAKTLGVDPRNPDQNLQGGAKYLKQMYDKFGSWDLALAAYNAGPGAVEKYHGIPPYTETQNYVKNIMGMVKGGIKGSDYNLILDDPSVATNAKNQSGVDTAAATTSSKSGAVSKAAVSYSGVGSPLKAANSKFSVGKLKTGMGSGKVSIKSYKVPKAGTSHIARNRPVSKISLNAKLPKRSALI